MDKYKVFIDTIADNPKDTIQAGLDYIGWDKNVKRSTTIFVKPNFTYPHYKEGVTTHPRFLRSLLEILRAKVDRVIVGESDGGNQSFTAEQSFEGHGMYDMCKELDIELVSLSKLPLVTVKQNVLGKIVSVKLPKMLLYDIDYFVSVPVLKLHVMTKVSLSIKNLWGCMPDPDRYLQHQNLVYKLALITELLNPQLVVIDGTYALNKHAPMYGEAVDTNLTIIADNPVTADSMGTHIMGFSPYTIKTITTTNKCLPGAMGLEDMDINCNWTPYERHFYLKLTLIDKISKLFFYSDRLARLVMASPLSKLAYKIAEKVRTPEEKELSREIGRK